MSGISGEGLIVKALSGYYYVLPENAIGSPIQCRARGIFRKNGVTPLVGDRVIYIMTDFAAVSHLDMSLFCYHNSCHLGK